MNIRFKILVIINWIFVQEISSFHKLFENSMKNIIKVLQINRFDIFFNQGSITVKNLVIIQKHLSYIRIFENSKFAIIVKTKLNSFS